MEVEIGTKENFPEGQGTLVEKEEKKIAVFNQKGKLFAIDHVCLHNQGPIADGLVDENNIVTCPWHGWQYNIETGENQSDKNMKLTTYKVTEKDGKVFLEI